MLAFIKGHIWAFVDRFCWRRFCAVSGCTKDNYVLPTSKLLRLTHLPTRFIQMYCKLTAVISWQSMQNQNMKHESISFGNIRVDNRHIIGMCSLKCSCGAGHFPPESAVKISNEAPSESGQWLRDGKQSSYLCIFFISYSPSNNGSCARVREYTTRAKLQLVKHKKSIKGARRAPLYTNHLNIRFVHSSYLSNLPQNNL